jgi:GNAT superfamily N-acetyltransferase
VPTLTALKTQWVRPIDLRRILPIDREVFGADAWDEPEFRRQLRRKSAFRHTVYGLVSAGDDLTAYLIYAVREERIQLLRFVVRPDARRKRVGSRLLVRAIQLCRSHNRPLLTCCVSEYNDAGLAFCRAVGMTATVTIPERFGEAAGVRFDYPI